MNEICVPGNIAIKYPATIDDGQEEHDEDSENSSSRINIDTKKARIKKACDSCNTRRTKCDGVFPCGHCSRSNLTCTYLRIEKKRGRASDKYPKVIRKRKDTLKKEKLQETYQIANIESEIQSHTENRIESHTNAAHFNDGKQVLGFSDGSDNVNNAIMDNSNIQPNFFNNTPPQNNFNFSPMSFAIDSPNDLMQNTPVLPPPLPQDILQQEECRYPVLSPIASILSIFGLPLEVACSALEHYFEEISPPCLMASLLRPYDFLITIEESQTRPFRNCSSALLLSIIALAFIDMEHPFLSNTSRKNLCTTITEHIFTLLPSDKSSGSIDDIMTYIHLGACSPAATSPLDTIYWFDSGVSAAMNLKINEEIDPMYKVSEVYRDERRRIWWTLYMLDRHGTFSCGKGLKVRDSDCTGLYHPHSDEVWRNKEIYDLPSAQDSGSPRGIAHDIVRSGSYGWLLPYSTILGGYNEYKKNSTSNFLFKETLLEYLKNFENKINLSKNIIPCNDYGYSLLYTEILKGMITNSPVWEPIERLDNPVDIIMSNDRINWLYKCVHLLSNIKKLDPDMRYHPLMSAFYLFILSIEFLSILENINIATINDLKNINDNDFFKNSANYINTITTSIESLNTTLHTEYLRIVRNYLRDSLRDVNRLLLLNEMDQSIVRNREKRRNMVSHISFKDGCAGVAVY